MDIQGLNPKGQEWAAAFTGKSEAEILTMPLPQALSDEECFRFRSLQAEAAKAARERGELALLQAAQHDLSAAARLSAPVTAAEPDLADGQIAPLTPPLPPPFPLPFAIPSGPTDALLDKQIASCAGIIEHLAHYIARYDTAVETCNKFMDRIGRLMMSSSEAALAVGRLRGMAPEGRRRR